MNNDQILIYESYKSKKVISEIAGLGQAAIGDGLGDAIHTDIVLPGHHQPSDLNPSHECSCKHGKHCGACSECECTEECEEYPESDVQEYTDHAKQKLYRIHRISEELHELIDHHAFKPWMADKITEALQGLSDIYDRVDYDASVKTHSDHHEISIPEEISADLS